MGKKMKGGRDGTVLRHAASFSFRGCTSTVLIHRDLCLALIEQNRARHRIRLRTVSNELRTENTVFFFRNLSKRGNVKCDKNKT